MYQIKAGMSTSGKVIRDYQTSAAPAIWPQSGGFWRHGVDLHHMPHLPAWPCRALAVEVDSRAGDGEPLLIAMAIGPDQVGHGDRAVTNRLAAGPAGAGADMLLELRKRRPRESPAPRTMQR